MVLLDGTAGLEDPRRHPVSARHLNVAYTALLSQRDSDGVSARSAINPSLAQLFWRVQLLSKSENSRMDPSAHWPWVVISTADDGDS